MSGHSHAATIKRDKEATDAKKGAAFSQIARLITIAVGTSGGITDPVKNFKLRMAFVKARQMNMPKENINRAIERAAGKGEGGKLSTNTYEGFGPGGTAVIVECITDNKNRTAAEIKNLFEKNGGNLAQPGAAAHFFDRKGRILVVKNAKPEEQMLSLIDLGVEDVEEKREVLEIYIPLENIMVFKDKITNLGFNVLEAEPVFKTKARLSLDPQALERVKKFSAALKAHEDVQKVFFNVDF